MNDRNWDAELQKIDRAMERVSDEAIFPAKSAPTQAARSAAAETQRTTSTLGVFLRLGISVVLGVAMVFWPYAARCGFGLFAYLAAVATLIAAGVWSATWAWRHHAGRSHLLSLLLLLWGLILGAMEVLPRVGYAVPNANHPARWICQ